MRAQRMAMAAAVVLGIGTSAGRAQPPAAPAPSPAPVPVPAATDAAGKLPMLLLDGPQPPKTSPAAACCPAATANDGQPRPFTPFMLGDFVGPVGNNFTQFKIAEGESPRPVDRAFFKYNYYNNFDKTRWADPTEPIHNVHLNIYTFGFEQTLFDGKASLGLRVPFYSLNGEAKDFRIGPDPATGMVGVIPGGPELAETSFGNLIAIAKVALWDDRQTGSLISGGVVVSFPTSSNQQLDPGLSTLMYFQPFGGFILARDDWFVHGFSSMTLPVARPESIVSFNDIGVGYYVYRNGDGLVSAVVPTFEIHYTAPIRQADPKTLIYNLIDNLHISDIVDLTFGATVELGNRATIGFGIAVPVTGPKPFDVEGLLQLNLLF